MRIGRHLWVVWFVAAFSIGTLATGVSYAGEVWVCTGSTANVSVSVNPFLEYKVHLS